MFYTVFLWIYFGFPVSKDICFSRYAQGENISSCSREMELLNPALNSSRNLTKSKTNVNTTSIKYIFLL